jgi:hypothetical protein
MVACTRLWLQRSSRPPKVDKKTPKTEATNPRPLSRRRFSVFWRFFGFFVHF